MTMVPGWHPMVVHFPLALGVTSAVFLTAARLARRDSYVPALATVGTWNLCLGAIAALFALATGLAAALGLEVSAAAHQAISSHLKWAAATTLLLVLLAVWRGAGSARDSRPSWSFIAVLLAMTAALMVTGYRGGQNVYRFGIGVTDVHLPSPRAAIACAARTPHPGSLLDECTGPGSLYRLSGMSLQQAAAYRWDCTDGANHSMRRTRTSQRRRNGPPPSSEGVHMRRTQ